MLGDLKLKLDKQYIKHKLYNCFSYLNLDQYFLEIRRNSYLARFG